MNNGQIVIGDLKQELQEIRERYPHLSADNLFVLWFLRAYVTETEAEAAKALTGGPNDKGLDALLIDNSARVVFLVQAKFRQEFGQKNETLSDVSAFADLAAIVCSADDDLVQRFLEDASPVTAERLRTARRKTRKDKYRVWLYFVTLGKVSPTIRKHAVQKVKQSELDARIELIDWKRAVLLFRDYLDGVAPPIPTLDLELEQGAGVTINGVSQRFDMPANVETWVFSMQGDRIADLYERGGLRLFARNIRGFLGMKTKINKGMLATLKNEPDRFYYYNNGITMVCDAAERKSSRGRDYIQVANPQIINGQQTTRTLASLPVQAAKASVLVKVMRISRDEEENGEHFERLVSRIVAGTNWQNTIRESDLMSNDRRQIEMERGLRKIGYVYLRKKQSKSEARRFVGPGFSIVTKEQLARASAGCELDPVIIRSGLDNLFSEGLYLQVFPNADPDYYLTRHWLLKKVTWAARGMPGRGYAKWLVLNFVWSRVRVLIQGRSKSRLFRTLCETKDKALTLPMNGAINEVFFEALKYYRANRGTGASVVDVSLFFRHQKGHHKKFAEFWKAAPQTRKNKFEKYLKKIKVAIDSSL